MNITIYDFNELGRTHKSIGVNEVITHAVANGVDTLSLISSGNYVTGILREVKNRGLEEKLKVINLSNEPLGLDCEEVVIEPGRILRNAEERELFVQSKLGDAIGSVRDYTDFIPQAYSTKAEEILGSQPDYVSLGVGSGKLFLAFAREIKKTNSTTKLVGILPRGENGVFNDENLVEKDGRLYFKQFNPKSPADKLVCPYTYNKSEILQTQREGHILIEADDRDFKEANRQALKIGLESEVSGSASFVLLDPNIRGRYHIPETSRVVLINTGRGYNWENIVRKRKMKKRFLEGLTSFAVAAVLSTGGYLHFQKPSIEEFTSADLDGNGRVSHEEVQSCNRMAGKGEGETLNRQTLSKIKEIKDKLVLTVGARYHDNYPQIRRALQNKVDFKFLDDLSFDQLSYLNDLAQFDDLSSPEMYRGRLMQNMQLSFRKPSVEPWDVR